MYTLSPLAASFFLVLAIGIIGAVIAYVRDLRRFAGYQDLTSEALRIARAVKGEVRRDGDDLVITGGWRELAVEVRFSHADNTPGLDIRMAAPASFTMSVMPAQTEGREVKGRVLVRTPDEKFNLRFVVRSDHPTHARLFISARNVMDTLRNLCRSSQMYLLISAGQVELGDLGTADYQTAGTVLERLQNLGELAHGLRVMPGADSIKIERPHRRRVWVARTALAIGVAALAVGLYVTLRPVHSAGKTAEATQAPEGITPADAAVIAGVQQWHIARAADFDAAAVTWLRSNGVEPEGRVEGDFCAGGSDRDTAYVLLDNAQKRRVVILCQGENRYDTKYEFVGVATRIPKDAVGSIEWSAAPPETPQADGLLITQRNDDTASGLVLFPHDRRIVFGIPKNYQNIKLR